MLQTDSLLNLPSLLTSRFLNKKVKVKKRKFLRVLWYNRGRDLIKINTSNSVLFTKKSKKKNWYSKIWNGKLKLLTLARLHNPTLFKNKTLSNDVPSLYLTTLHQLRSPYLYSVVSLYTYWYRFTFALYKVQYVLFYTTIKIYPAKFIVLGVLSQKLWFDLNLIHNPANLWKKTPLAGLLLHPNINPIG